MEDNRKNPVIKETDSGSSPGSKEGTEARGSWSFCSQEGGGGGHF